MRKPVVCIVAGARPNFMKIAPILRAVDRSGRLDRVLVHTGQHYDREMNDVFFEELGIPRPDVYLGAGGGGHAEQTARIMVAFEAECRRLCPDVVLVVGDVNSTLACSIVAKKLGIRVAHVEAGLRSGDMSMPEEVNRIVTDSISDFFFVTEPSGLSNLVKEGKPRDSIFEVGHVMVDNLLYQVEKLSQGGVAPAEVQEFLASKAHPAGRFGVVTLHRPANVDDPVVLRRIAEALGRVSAMCPLLFPVHPRTRANLERFGVDLGGSIILTGPLSYMSFLRVWKDAAVVLTDSGGLQEETTALGVPCLTLRDNTERPVTVEEGTNIIVGTDPQRIVACAEEILRGGVKRGRCPDLWDGRAAERIVDVLCRQFP